MAKSSGKDKGEQAADAAGLDIAGAPVPGTFMGAHDLQGTDGEKRTDRPGELLGTAVTDKESGDIRDRARKLAAAGEKAMTEAVDKANREELPKLGGAEGLEAAEAAAKAEK